ncbi:HPF/RaiA family ribosome-associated protein [Calothrix sp. NIES-3974]|uniref:HPF/RaiA family ribosome-associated protein n=1 Tax=Calothrix sp. NIES-3974 TaxID=2005462 RepID=UPI000B607859|nr:HPF/RaiA family ribosome-associated protein [Calothrix sp. NIES-3974]BAZ04751.1 cold-shock DNA-binding protein family [Calothrix sp. NIES-3974]
MQTPLQVTFRNVQSSATVESKIREYVEKLNKLYNRITSCRVVVDLPHRNQNKGKLYHVQIDLTVPQGELVINRNPSQNQSHTNLYVALHDAFDIAKRQLISHLDMQRKV